MIKSSCLLGFLRDITALALQFISFTKFYVSLGISRDFDDNPHCFEFPALGTFAS
jgi:hypothetical protein